MNTEKREDILSSLQRRAENIQMRLQSGDTAHHEIEGFVKFLNQDDNKNHLTSVDIEKLYQQITDFQKSSEQNKMQEIIQDLQYVLDDFKRYYEELIQAIEYQNQYELDSALSKATTTGQRFEREIQDYATHESVKPLIEDFQVTKQAIGKALQKLQTQEEESEQVLLAKEQEEEAKQAQAEQALKDKWYEIPTVFPPALLTDDYNRQVGRIVFSHQPIKVGKEEANDIKNHFEAGEQVFGMAYLPDTRQKVGFERGVTFSISDTEDGRGFATGFELYQAFRYDLNDEKQAKNAHSKDYDIDILVAYQDAWDKELAKHTLQFLHAHLQNAPLSAYGDNSHKVHRFRVELLAEGMLIAAGEFTYDLRSGHEKIAALYQSHEDAFLQSFKLPESKRQDPELAEKLKQIMERQGDKVLKVIFSEPEWWIERHKLSGVALNRTIAAYIVQEEKNGNCYYNEVFFKEEYIGDTLSGVIVWKGIGAAGGKILKENI